MNRCLESEWLDELPPTDPQAHGSRRDLRRLNWWMRHAQIAASSLQSLKTTANSRRITDLGGGDARFLLSVARTLGSDWGGTRAVIVDRQRIVAPATLAA